MRARLKNRTKSRPAKAVLLLGSLGLLALAGCARPGIVNSQPIVSPAVEGDIQRMARNVPRIRMTAGIPTKEQLCDMQREHARQEAFLDTLVDGKQVQYQAECDLKPATRGKAKKKSEPKAS